MCERNHSGNWHLKWYVPFCLAGLLMGAACGAPDEVKRVSVSAGGHSSVASGGAGAGGSEASSDSSSLGGSSAGGSSSIVTSSSPSGGKTSSGGTTASGGKGGTSTSSKGGSTGGRSTISSKSSSVGGGGGSSTYPPVGGKGGTTSTKSATGGSTTGTSSTSTTPAPSTGLGVYTKGITSGNGAIILDVRIDNQTAQTADVSAVTMRYWYQDEGLGTTLVFDSNYVSIGYSTDGKVAAVKALKSSSGAGADHYLELSLTGTLAAKGDTKQNDQFNIKVTVHTSGWTGKVDLTNDYSYNAGATGYNEKITLHSGDKVIWGDSPEGGGGGETPSDPDAGAVDAASVH